MRTAGLFWREIRFRPGTFMLGLLGVATFAACLIGSRAFLAARIAAIIFSAVTLSRQRTSDASVISRTRARFEMS